MTLRKQYEVETQQSALQYPHDDGPGYPSYEYVEWLEAKVEQLKSQLPEGMQKCTIRFKSCKIGHGRLTATNWVQDDKCPQCEIEKLQAENKHLKHQIKIERANFVLSEIVNDEQLFDDLMAVCPHLITKLEHTITKKG